MQSLQKIPKGQLQGVVESVVAGANVTVDNTDPKNLIVSASGGGGTSFKGNWNAETNTPTLANGTGTSGDEYRVTSSYYRFGDIFLPNDIISYDGSGWFKKQDNNQNFRDKLPIIAYNVHSGTASQNLGEGGMQENAAAISAASPADDFILINTTAYFFTRRFRTTAVANALTNFVNGNWARIDTDQAFYLNFAIQNADVSANTASRFLYGWAAGISGNIDPSQASGRGVGIASDSADTNVQIFLKDTIGAGVGVTKINTGWNKTNLNDRYNVVLFREKSSSKMFYIVTNETLNQTIKGVFTFNNTALAARYYKGSGANAIASGFHHILTKLNTALK